MKPGGAPDPERLAALTKALRQQQLQAMDLFAALEPELVPLLSPEQHQTLDQAIQDLRFGQALEQLAFLFPPATLVLSPAPESAS